MWIKLRAFLEQLFPPTCANCGKLGALFCDSCAENIRWIMPPVCHYCGRPIPHASTLCTYCYRKRPHLASVRAAVWFGKPIRHAIYQLKYDRKPHVAPPLAEMMVARWAAWSVDVDMLVPVPLHPDRLAERGFNQAQLLAEQVAAAIDIPLETEAVFRVKATRKQPGLTYQERKANVSGAFVAHTKRVRGQRILLIDDVVTTGSTLRASADALYAAGAETVSAYCLARATGSDYSRRSVAGQ